MKAAKQAATAAQRTLVGRVDEEVLAFTVGRDPELDRRLVEVDCIGTAAHVTMLAAMRAGGRRLFSAAERDRVVAALVDIMREARAGRFEITRADQDVHLAVERLLTERLDALGRRVHTGRSRNDQVATDLRLYARQAMLDLLEDAAVLAAALLRLARRHELTPMVGRTHMQPAMPSSVGLWASAHAEGLLDDCGLLMAAYDYNDRCPLGSAASYGVPLPIDRELSACLLGFAAPVHNVLAAGNARGKTEAVILGAAVNVMLTLSRLAEDLILFSTPEMPYFRLPPELCTGSSIMPQKQNPDVAELVRARARRVAAHHAAAVAIVSGLPSGYNRDLQEIKEPFLDGLDQTRACVRIMTRVIDGLDVDAAALRAAFGPGVFATDRALELVAGGMSFRDAYAEVKAHLSEVGLSDPDAAVRLKTHLGAPAGLDLDLLAGRGGEVADYVHEERRAFAAAMRRLLKVSYPDLEPRGRTAARGTRKKGAK